MSSSNARSKLIRNVSVAVALVVGGVSATMEAARPATQMQMPTSSPSATALQRDSLCAKSEHTVFSCRVKGSGKNLTAASAKIVSLCASPDLDNEHGYLQYRFGLPNRIELEFPKSRQSTQQLFTYTHYFRFQVDLTEISFNIDGYEYRVFDDYNGEEKPPITLQGVSVTAPGKPKDVTLTCRTKAKADFSTVADVLKRDQE